LAQATPNLQSILLDGNPIANSKSKIWKLNIKTIYLL
jgi:hypothetical protein